MSRGRQPCTRHHWDLAGMVLQGNGTSLRRSCGCPYGSIFAEDGGDESEIAGVTSSTTKGSRDAWAWRRQTSSQTMFSRKRTISILASCKLRECSYRAGTCPRSRFSRRAGVARVYRESALLWQKPIQSGERICATRWRNMEHHHFKFPCIGVPGCTVHFSAPAASALAMASACERRREEVTLPALAGPCEIRWRWNQTRQTARVLRFSACHDPGRFLVLHTCILTERGPHVQAILW